MLSTISKIFANARSDSTMHYLHYVKSKDHARGKLDRENNKLQIHLINIEQQALAVIQVIFLFLKHNLPS